MTGMIKTLVHEIARERENKRYKREVEKILRERKRQTITPMEQEDFLNTLPLEEKRDIDKKRIKKEPTTMEEWEKLGYFDCELDKAEKENRMLELYEQALQFCKHREMEIEVRNQLFFIKTIAGRWYFDPLEERRTLYHGNYDITKNTPGRYHLQYTKEESLESTLSYIEMHDRKKEKMRLEKERKYFENTLT